MSINSVNQATYTSEEGVNAYLTTTLQSPEISIFVKYKDFYYSKKILDIGCGTGRTSFYFRNFTNDYLGVDYSESMIRKSKKCYPELEFQHCDARDLSRFKDCSFDFIIFSYNGIDYISNNDRLAVLKEIKRILKDDGMFVFSTHNRTFSNIETTPSFQFSLNPVNFTRNLLGYFKQLINNSKLKNEKIETEDYAILNDSGNNFSLLTYYISKEKQIEQLRKVGFNMQEMFDMNGQVLNKKDNDSNNAWIYYVTTK